MPKEPMIIGEIKIGDYRKIMVSIVEYKGEERLDIREKYDTNLSIHDPNFVMTKRGVQIPSTKWKKFYNMIVKDFKPYL